ncbi:hypothetical protein FI667_g15033, partial [Globisporangium splendens]
MKTEDHGLRTTYMAADDGDLHVLQSNGGPQAPPSVAARADPGDSHPRVDNALQRADRGRDGRVLAQRRAARDVPVDDQGRRTAQGAARFVQLVLGQHRVAAHQAKDYVTFMERNHLFVEHPLQAAYTAGFYFLFQNAVVRDLQPLQNTEGFFGYTLAFLGNIQEIDVRASIPTLNIGFTIGGCVLLVLFSGGVILFGKRIEDSLRKDENAHLVAEVMVNDYKFPTLLLGKSIEHQPDRSSSMAGKKVPLSDFRASAITLQDTTTGNRVSLFDAKQIHFNA